jgi:hypothetical protein
MRLNNIYTIKTKAKAIKAWASNNRIHVVINEHMHAGNETYVISFDVQELINLGLQKVKNACNL